MTKVTFYRHFHNKNELIREYFEFRHQRWMAWFMDSLQRHGNSSNSIVPALDEWFSDVDFRGCAFINSVAELGEAIHDIIEITQRHKLEMTTAIVNVLPQSKQRTKDAQAIALAIDGAIIRAQVDQVPDDAVLILTRILKLLQVA